MGAAIALAGVGGAVGGLSVWAISRLVSAYGSGASVVGPASLLVTLAAFGALFPIAAEVLAREAGRRAILKKRIELVDNLELHTDLNSHGDPGFHKGLQTARSAIEFAYLRQPSNILGAVSGAATTAAVAGAVATISVGSALAIGVSVVPLAAADRATARRQANTLERLGVADRARASLEEKMHSPAVAADGLVYRAWTAIRRRYGSATAEASRLQREQDLSILAFRIASTLAVSGLTAVALILASPVGADAAERAGAGAAVVSAVLFIQSTADGWSKTIWGVFEANLVGRMAETFFSGPAPNQLGMDAQFEDVNSVVFADVWFRYSADAPWIFKGLSLSLNRGSLNVLLGENGTGKSTLALLAAGLLTPTRGTVSWDGRDVASIKPTSRAAVVSLVPQSPERYGFELGEAIRLGRSVESLPDDVVAAELASFGLDQLLQDPAALETRLAPGGFAGELEGAAKGRALSGGEWQRIALARALVERRPIVVADEPNSSLDEATDQMLIERLRGLADNSFCLLVTHRSVHLGPSDTCVQVSELRTACGEV